MRLPPNRLDAKWVAASKPQVLGMVENTRGRLNTYGNSLPGAVNINQHLSRNQHKGNNETNVNLERFKNIISFNISLTYLN